MSQTETQPIQERVVTAQPSSGPAVHSSPAAPKKISYRSLRLRRDQQPLPLYFYQPLITAVQVAVDLGTVALSYLLGFVAVRQFFDLGQSATMAEGFSSLLFPLTVSLITVGVGFHVNGLYHPHRSILNIRELEVLLKTCLVACGLSLSVLFLAENQFFSREVFAATWIIMIGLMMTQRTLVFRFQNYLRESGVVQTSALIYGAGEVGIKLMEKLHQSPKLGYRVAGFVEDEPHLKGKNISDIPVLGGFGDIRSVLRETQAKKLFVALPQIPHKVVEELLDICREEGCEFQLVPTLYDIVIQRVKLSEVDGIPLIGVSEPRYSWRTMVAKRIFDLIAACLLLVLLSPLFLVFAAIVKFSSPGPVLFRQNRVGKNGRNFLFYKFRSMYVDAPVYAETPHDSKDRRITPIGRFLRRTSLDELPQLWNVIKGDMSLVGPRPEMPFIVEKYNDLQRQRLNVRPGITGLWQISPDRKLAIHQNMDYDMYYINNQSFMMDVAILIRTAFSCVKGVGAY